MLLAIPVHRTRFKPLMFLPERFARMLRRIFDQRPGALKLGAFIFAFNSCAIFLYMLTGVIPGAPAVVAALTGLNVALASVLSQKEMPERELGTLWVPFTARIGAVMTFLLELPCLWFALAMGQSIQPNLPALLGGGDPTNLQQRVLTYGMVIVPALAVSALAEAHAVTSALRAPTEAPDTPDGSSDEADEDSS